MELNDLLEGEPEVRRHWFNDNEKVKLLAACLAVVAAALNIFGHFQKATWTLAVGIAILLLFIVVPVAVQRINRMLLSRRERQVAEREHKKLERCFERFARVCIDRNYTRSFLYILYSASAYQQHIVVQILGADYISSWVACFETQIKSPCDSLMSLLTRCREFCVIVRSFNTDYVIRAQKGLDDIPRVPKETFEQFEAFREDFAHLLRDIEEWIDEVNKEADKQLAISERVEATPSAHFERVKPFVWKSLGAKPTQ